jgi:predicted GNAT superfamily acetyltransferase
VGDGPRSGDLVVRDLDGIDEFREAVGFQESIWGRGFSERVPASLMKVTRRLGGVVAGAFTPDGRMVGFVYGMTGPEEGRLIHWSDILAVSPEIRDRGIGRLLKGYQRRRVLQGGVTLMRWTFDPLESRNAYLNLGHLGALVREYAVDMYGDSDSPLHRGLGTDRFVVSWELDTSRVEARLAGERPPSSGDFQGLEVAFPVRPGAAGPEPGLPVASEVSDLLDRASRSPGIRLPIPADIQGLRDRDPELAGRWRSATRAVLEPALRRGWVVRELLPPSPGALPVSYYVLAPETGGGEAGRVHSP